MQRMTHVYREILPHAGLWEHLLERHPEIGRRLQRLGLDPARPPGLDTPASPDGLTVGRHLELAESKAGQPPRIALVGPFSVGKSTLLNALTHGLAFQALLRQSLGTDKPLLDVGVQPTTGNVTELAFTGEDPDDEGVEPFRFSATYMTEAECRGLIRHFDRKMGLGIGDAVLDGPDWWERLREVPARLGARYAPLENRKNLRVLWEMIESLQDPEVRAKLQGPEAGAGPDDDRNSRTGPEGLSLFRALQTRPRLETAETWEGNRPLLSRGDFHFVKALRVRLAHPDYRGLRFSLFDFPGLGSGLHRDEYVSRWYIAEANVIALVYRPDIVGGEAVNAILDAFTAERPKLPAEKLLERIFFVQNGRPGLLPAGEALAPFYRDFLVAVKTLMGPILDRCAGDAGRRRELLKTYLGHFLACDALVGGYMIAGEVGKTPEALKGEHQARADKGFFSCPTDLGTLERLASDPTLNDSGGSYPLLAGALAEPGVGATIAEFYGALKTRAGIDGLAARVRRFVLEDGPRVQAEDVREHLKAAATPLATLRELSLEPVAPGRAPVPVEAFQAREAFQAAVEGEDRWADVLNAWANGLRSEHQRGDPALREALEALEAASAGLDDRVRERVESLVGPESFDRFCRPLDRPDRGLLDWIEAYAARQEGGGGDLDEPGGYFGDEEEAPGPTLLRLDHTLVLYRYYLDRREEILRFLRGELLGPLVTEVVRLHAERVGPAWESLNRMYREVLAWVDQRERELDAEFCGWRARNATLDATLRGIVAQMGGPDWGPRRDALEGLVRRGDRQADPLLERAFGIRSVRLDDWVPGEPLPADAAQLAVCLARMRLVPTDSVRLRHRQAPRLPELSRSQVLGVLKAAGVLAPDVAESQVTFAEEGADYWAAPLPALDGALRDPETGALAWNPVPFNPYLGPISLLRRPGPGGADNTDADADWVAILRDDLNRLASELAYGAARWWRRERLWTLWEKNLTRLLHRHGDGQFILFRWLDQHADLLAGGNPLAARLAALRAALDECRDQGLIP